MAEGGKKACLFVLSGPDMARSFHFDGRATVGRSDECDIVLKERSISRKHAVLECSEQRWFVKDLGSTNGVTKNEERGERFELTDGDEFRLGDLLVRFKLLEAAESEEIEFDFEPPAAIPTAPPPPALGSARVDRGEPEVEIESEVEIEDEIEIEGSDAPIAASPRPLSVPSLRPRAERHTALFAGDLEQRPLWFRTLIVLVLLVLGAGLAYGAFSAVQLLRAGL